MTAPHKASEWPEANDLFMDIYRRLDNIEGNRGGGLVGNVATAAGQSRSSVSGLSTQGTSIVLNAAKINNNTANIAANTARGVVQKVNVQDGAVATGTTAIPYDDTIPQNTEGDEYMTLAITPTDASNRLEIKVVFHAAHTVNGRTHVTLFQDAIASAIAVGTSSSTTATIIRNVVFFHDMVAGSTLQITFKVRAGNASGATTTFNGTGGARKFGGVMASSITITEYKV